MTTTTNHSTEHSIEATHKSLAVDTVKTQQNG
jgi:hypothetical protein